MNNYRMISDYMNMEKYRKDFNKLSIETFGLDFEEWYEKGLFYDRYICYSFMHEGSVISNVSINKMNLIVDGEEKKAIQLGTVMTHPSYRNQGLSALLIKHVIEEYENKVDIIYLFANDSVLDFYPKFGFKKIYETAYELDTKQLKKKDTIIRKLNTEDEKDYKIILRLTTNRQPVSERLGVYNDVWPLMVYCLYMYKQNLFYLEEEDVIVVASRETGRLHIYDVISRKSFDLDSIIEKIVEPDDTSVQIHFITALTRYKIKNSLKQRENNTLFVISKNTSFKEILFPMTSHT